MRSKYENIQSDIFYMLVRDRECAPHTPVFVDGAPNFSSVEIRNTIEFDRICFNSGIVLSHAKFASTLVFRNCEFRGPIDANNIEVGGDLIFENCIFHESKKPIGNYIELETARIDGSLIFEGLGQPRKSFFFENRYGTAVKRISATNARIKGRFKLTESDVGQFGNFVDEALVLNGIQMDGTLRIGGGESSARPTGNFDQDKKKLTNIHGKLLARGERSWVN